MLRKRFAVLLAVLVLPVLAAGFIAARKTPAAQRAPIQNAAPAQIRSGEISSGHTLFPGLNEAAITAITVSTPDRSFSFLRESADSVSVNGQQADSEVFLTLLEQIADLPVDSFAAFTPKNDQLLLTLVISADGAQHTAHFYNDGASGEKAHIISGSTSTPQYSQTGGWRVGTLMLTCEGTRIQDMQGNETPVKLKIEASKHDRP